MKAFGYIERAVKSDFFLGKYPFLQHACATCSEQPSNIKNYGYNRIRTIIQKNHILSLSFFHTLFQVQNLQFRFDPNGGLKLDRLS